MHSTMYMYTPHWPAHPPTCHPHPACNCIDPNQFPHKHTDIHTYAHTQYSVPSAKMSMASYLHCSGLFTMLLHPRGSCLFSYFTMLNVVAKITSRANTLFTTIAHGDTMGCAIICGFIFTYDSSLCRPDWTSLRYFLLEELSYPGFKNVDNERKFYEFITKYWQTLLLCARQYMTLYLLRQQKRTIYHIAYDDRIGDHKVNFDIILLKLESTMPVKMRC